MAKHFAKGFFLGTLTTLGAVACSVVAFKKSIIEPQESYEEKLEENRRKANRKAHAAHQG